ncbi:hypothetical protein TREES_T100017130 [Tupaia chinensis]|uniref:Uncharacterized protein n=1 Tax=Tupaia chinensis TaxID=246437 RepID=L9KIU3_TUPCH|nr:hypothetical protein TREES_T100017130 [Tupaia chinensis]
MSPAVQHPGSPGCRQHAAQMFVLGTSVLGLPRSPSLSLTLRGGGGAGGLGLGPEGRGRGARAVTQTPPPGWDCRRSLRVPPRHQEAPGTERSSSNPVSPEPSWADSSSQSAPHGALRPRLRSGMARAGDTASVTQETVVHRFPAAGGSSCGGSEVRRRGPDSVTT